MTRRRRAGARTRKGKEADFDYVAQGSGAATKTVDSQHDSGVERLEQCTLEELEELEKRELAWRRYVAIPCGSPERLATIAKFLSPKDPEYQFFSERITEIVEDGSEDDSDQEGIELQTFKKKENVLAYGSTDEERRAYYKKAIKWYSSLRKSRCDVIRIAIAAAEKITGYSLESGVRDQLLIIAAVDDHVDLLKNLGCKGDDVSRLALERRAKVYSQSEETLAYLRACLEASPLEKIRCRNIAEAVVFGRTDLVLQYLEDVDNPSSERMISLALLYAADKTKTDCVRLLLEKSPDLLKASYQYSIWGYSTYLDKESYIVCDLTGKPESVSNLNYGSQILMKALSGRSLEESADCVASLLAQGADPNATDKYRDLPLMLAAREGRVECVRVLLAAGADLNTKEKCGSTALIRAASRGHVECVSLLLEKGANPNAKNSFGRTALRLAAIRGRVECVRALLKDSKVAEDDKRVALSLAAESGRVECVKRLLPHTIKDDHNNALILASNKGHTACVEALLEEGADPNAKNKYGEAALWLSAYEGHVVCVRALLKDSRVADENKNVALRLAVGCGYIDCVRALLSVGADPNAKKRYGETALSLAAHRGHVDCLRELLVAGADVSLQNEQGETALDLAEKGKHRKCIALLKKGNTTLMHFLEMGDTDRAQSLLESDTNLNLDARNQDGSTALHFAAYYNPTLVRLLLARGANPWVKRPDEITPLTFALRKEHHQSICFLAIVMHLLKSSESYSPDLFKRKRRMGVVRELTLEQAYNKTDAQTFEDCVNDVLTDKETWAWVTDAMRDSLLAEIRAFLPDVNSSAGEGSSGGSLLVVAVQK